MRQGSESAGSSDCRFKVQRSEKGSAKLYVAYSYEFKHAPGSPKTPGKNVKNEGCSGDVYENKGPRVKFTQSNGALGGGRSADRRFCGLRFFRVANPMQGISVGGM
jgi:hypothetical protein